MKTYFEVGIRYNKTMEDGKELTVNIDDAPNIVRCIRGKHIKHAYGEEGM